MSCDLSDLFDPQGNDLLLDYDRGSDDLPYAPVIMSQSACYGQRGVIKTRQGQDVRLVLPVVDRNGSPIPLVEVEEETSDSSESSGGSEPGPSTVALLVRFYAKPSEASRTLSINKECTIHNAARGLVTCVLTQGDLARPGLQTAQVVIFSPDGSKLYQATDYWLHVSPSLNHSTTGALTIQEIRMVVSDRCPEANVLMDAFEFDDEEIAMFIRRAVDEFNEKYQPPTHFTAQNFPWRFHWSLGVAGNMLRSKAIQKQRNRLAYQAGGVSIKDSDYAGEYMKMAVQLIEEWQQFIVSHKRTLNYESGFMTAPSGYAYAQRYR